MKKKDSIRNTLYEYINTMGYVYYEVMREMLEFNNINIETAGVFLRSLAREGGIEIIKDGNFITGYKTMKSKLKKRRYQPYNKISTKHDNFHITDIESDNALQGYSNMLSYFLEGMILKGKLEEAKQLVETSLYKTWIDCIDSVDYTKLIPKQKTKCVNLS